MYLNGFNRISFPQGNYSNVARLSQGIVTARMKRMAFQQSFHAEKAAFEETVSLKRLNEIGRAGGIKPTGGREQRRNEFSV
jgi:hypothetical protein